MHEVTIVGGGVAGLIAAVECAEAGVPVRVLEAHGHLGGRAVGTPGPFVAN
ncbi:MAG TPA: NAD(P)-binding protein, partial [Acidimicrobiia bacterium]|nr:NAD(P)-binding protein [Acidimicrobiia bacterium]